MKTQNQTPVVTGFPPLNWEEEDPSTRPMGLHELPKQFRIDRELDTVCKFHPHIGKAIGVFWGHRDCVDYIQQLILKGADGAGNSRVGFRAEVLSALINLTSLHEIKPG